ncbi:MAG: TlyA family RNA methyltransferase [Opitutales bacterium]|nr:TlyA family RNA methyltransferase [Opitutales bacterium]
MKRADELLAERGLAESRSKARAIIEEGRAFCGGEKIDKPSRKLPLDAEIRVDKNADALKFVSRAGLKLDGFLSDANLDVSGFDILDIGASTGGFTDCLLSRGAKSAVCVDVGTGQLHEKIKADPRVLNLEKTDARNLTSAMLNGALFDFICADLSFISLEKVIPHIWGFLRRGGYAAFLVKPQFETEPRFLRRTKGVLKDDALRGAALEKIKKFVAENFADAVYVCDSPSKIAGGDGNREYLLLLKKS